jgi:formate hydrogenlyase transcriptional activator
MKRPPSIFKLYNSLLHVNQVAISKSTPETVFEGMCEAIRTIVPHDRAGLTLYDPDRDNLRIAALCGAYGNSSFNVGDSLDCGASQSGWTFTNQRITLRRNLPRDLQFHSEQQTADEGFRSLCSVPLVVRGSSIGVVTVVGLRINQFSVADARIVQRMCNQITLAISSLVPRCKIHPKTKLLCPKCIGAAGAKVTLSKYRTELSNWGKKGGRTRKPPHIP